MTVPSSPDIRIANAPCSWGALEFDLKSEPIGFRQVLDEIRDTGYVGTELGDWGFMPSEPGPLRAELAARSLSLVGAFVPVAFDREEAYTEGEDRAIRTAKLMAEAAGTEPFIVLADDNCKIPDRTRSAGRIVPSQSLSHGHWHEYGDRVTRLAAAIRGATGLRSVFHHHAAGYVETPWEIDDLMDHTDPALVGLCFDTGHFRFGGGGDPLAMLRRYRDRIWHVHYKDCSPAVHEQSRQSGWDYFESLRHGIFCELGNGAVDFPALTAELRRTGYRGWIVVEQDVLPGMGAPKDCAQRNRECLRRCDL
jgi:inosose dehydratase